MIHIILTILKVIGILILVILGLLLLIVLSVLLLPFKYGGKIQYDENNFNAVIKGRYLFGLVRIKAEYADKKFNYYVRVFWKELIGKKKKTKTKDIEESSKTKENEDILDILENDEINNVSKSKANIDVIESDVNCDINKTNDTKENIYIKESSYEEQDKMEVEVSEERTKRKRFSIKDKFISIKTKILSIKSKIIYKIKGFCDKLKNINTKKDKILKFINQEDTKEFFRYVRHQVYLLFKHILPYKVKGKFKFGMESPDKTGQILAAASIVKAKYGKKIDVIPDFNQKVIEVDLRFKGRIRVVNLLLIAFRVYRQKKLKQIIKLIKK